MKNLLLTASILVIGVASLSNVLEKTAHGDDPGEELNAPGRGPQLASFVELAGSSIQGPRGRQLGILRDLLLDAREGKIASAIVASGGLFGMGADEHLIPWHSLQTFLRPEADRPDTEGPPGHEFGVIRSVIPLDAPSPGVLEKMLESIRPPGILQKWFKFFRPRWSAGGIVAADVNDDGARDLLVTTRNYIGAYGTDAKRLWSKRLDVRVSGQPKAEGLPGHHGPGVQAGDIDGDGRTEVVFLDHDSTLHVLRGEDGKELWAIKLEPPAGAERWEHVVVANFRGRRDRDLLLQATAADDHLLGKHVAAYAAETLQAGEDVPLWRRDDFLACAHNGARVADLDGDGRDEIVGGGVILGPRGDELVRFEVKWHIDSVFIEDVRPDLPGLEVVLLEEGPRNRIFLAGTSGVIWSTSHRQQEPQNAAVGRFLPGRAERQIWCRSRYPRHQKPFVFDNRGNLLAEYDMDEVAPGGWTTKGVEVIHSIHWSGDRQHACAKERHTWGDVGLFDPISGRFLLRLPERASRLYVADVVGDWREEIIVWSGSELHLYRNPQPPTRRRPRLWDMPHYRRNKMTWNYYSP